MYSPRIALASLLLFAADAVAAPQFSSCTVSQRLSSGQSAVSAPDGIGQSFTACQRGQITSIKVSPLLIGSPNAVLGLQAGFGVANAAYSQNVTLSAGVSTIVLSQPFPVEAGTLYSFALFATSGLLGFREQSGDPYPGGEFFFMSNGIATRTGSNPDLDFEVQIDPIPSATCSILQPLSSGQSAVIAPDGIGQSFTACGEGNVRRIKVNVLSVANPNVVLQLQQGFGVPSGTYTQNVTLSAGINTIDLTTPFPVRPGVEYSFALLSTSGLLGFREQSGNPYPGGEFFFMANGVATRSSGSPDLEFEVGIDLSNARCTFRNGTGVNPSDYACTTDPVIGSSWDSSIATNGSTSATFLLLSNAPTQVPYLGSEVLVLAPLALMSPTGSHSIPIPYDAPLVGLTLFTQGARIDLVSGAPAVVLLNAQDMTIGF